MLSYPLVHDLRVAQLAQLAEQFFWDRAHLVPGGGGINLAHHRRNGAAASDGHAQVVHRIFIRRALQSLELLQNALHPMKQTPVVRESPRTGSKGCHSSFASLNRSAPQVGLRPRPNGGPIAYPSVVAASSRAVENSSGGQVSLRS